MSLTGEERPLVGGSRSCSLSSCEQGELQVFLYHHREPLMSVSDSALTFTYGEYSAEELSIAAAKACGILPVYHSLFALATKDLMTWFPPNHIFMVDEATSQVVVYRIRFFFPNWFGLGNSKSVRCGLVKGRDDAVLNYAVIDYLFAQCRSDFISRGQEATLSLKMQEEFLALAVLDMMRITKESGSTLQQTLDSVSYKACIPESFRQQIQQLSIVTRKRIRKKTHSSLQQIGTCNSNSHYLKLKYLIDLERLGKTFDKETFCVRTSMASLVGRNMAEKLIRVSGENGISWTYKGTEKWQLFCDFPEITDVSIKQASCDNTLVEGRIVTVTKQDNKVLEAQFPTLKEALSFVALIDGYFRLTKDSHHYFYKEVAPPRLLWNIQNHCHGPITSEFAVHKLKKMGDIGSGHYILRSSLQDFDQYFLTVCVETPLGKDFKDCLIQKTELGFAFLGVDRHFSSMAELLENYHNCSLHAKDVTIQLRSCCPPRPKEKSNLLIMRGSGDQALTSPSMHRRTVNQMSFHKIQQEDIAWGESLGQGSFTKIFRGIKQDMDDEETHQTPVLLKVLDSAYKNYSESFLEAASLMSQISHKHLLLLYGVCVGKDNIMVQEYMKHGALDIYLKKHKSSCRLTASWKLEVTKQLAYALHFLEDMNIVHGNVSAKKVLLAREGDVSSQSPPFIKLSDPGVRITALSREMLLERIPWVAPECVENPQNLALVSDKWSFGVTVWEIFSGGAMPRSVLEPTAKLQFYQDRLQLPAPKWIELDNLIKQCMNYRADLRPSFRAIIRDLNNLITSDYELLADQPPWDQLVTDSNLWKSMSQGESQDPAVYEERHLKYISMLGKGNFGSVELYRYDPLRDNTGELVAVKKLQHSTAEHMETFQKEIAILKALHNSFIVQYKGVCYGAGRKSLRLVMEYLPNGSLREYLQKYREQLNPWKLLLFASQICQGMEYLGSQRYVHRDLAVRNILVESNNCVKIGDFGLAKILPQDKEYYVVRERGESPIFWYAPESLSDNVFSRESDVWSFGVLLYELFTYAEKCRNPPAGDMNLDSGTSGLQQATFECWICRKKGQPYQTSIDAYILCKQGLKNKRYNTNFHKLGCGCNFYVNLALTFDRLLLEMGIVHLRSPAWARHPQFIRSAKEFQRMMGVDRQLQPLSHLLELLREGRRLPVPPGCPTQVYSLMQSCWADRPIDRPSFKELALSMDALRDSQSNMGG